MSRPFQIQIALLLTGGGLLAPYFIIHGNFPLGNLFLYLSVITAAIAWLFASRNISEIEIDRNTILGSAILLHLAILPVPLFLYDDVFRYIWDGLVQANAVNPYLYLPHAEELYGLRDFEAFEYMRDQFGIYTHFSPVYQVLFRFSIYLEALLGFQGLIFFYKLLSAGINIGIIVLLYQMLADGPSDSRKVVWYAWNPVVILLICSQGLIIHLPVFIFLYFLKLWNQHQAELQGVLWGILLHLSGIFWFILPLLFKRDGWKAPGIAIATWLLWWLPLLDMEGFTNYLAVLWFNLHTVPENLSPISLLQHLPDWISMSYAALFLFSMTAVSFFYYKATDAHDSIDFLHTTFLIAGIYFLLNPVWSPALITLLIMFTVLVRPDSEKLIPLSLMFLFSIPVVVESQMVTVILQFLTIPIIVYFIRSYRAGLPD